MRWIVAALIAVLALAGVVAVAYQACACGKQAGAPTGLLAMAEDAVFLPGTAWTVAELRGKPAVGTNPLTLQFDANGTRAFGHAGCNRYFATAAVDGAALTLSGIGSTKMYCHAEGVMAQEGVFLSTLGAVKTVRVESGQLLLLATDGAVLVKLSKNAGPA